MQEENQDIAIAVVAGIFFILLFGFITFMVIANYFKQKRRLLLERHNREAGFRQALMKAQMEMQEHTFKNISQEIHDNVGQILSLIKLNMNILSMEMKHNEEFNTIRELLGNAISELRDLGAGYHSEKVVDAGLVEGIRKQMEQLAKTKLFTTCFHSHIGNLNLERDKIIFLYRMVQEALNNIVRHSGASHVVAEIYQRNDDVYITLKDNGKGFRQNSTDFKPGIGLISMRERAAMIDAKMDIKSESGLGTTVSFIFKQSA
jgi:signal transduction histidine kinase